MSFSKEDRKKVLGFFVELLLKINEPIYYENLRGHVTKADPVIRQYIRKECKGVKLLDYFQRHTNYFFVDLKNNVMLLKNEKVDDIISKANKVVSKHDSIVSDNVNHEEILSNSNYSDCSRSNSISSRYGSRSSSIDNDKIIFVDDETKDKSEYKKIAVEYFRDYLTLESKLDLNALEIQCLPESVQWYIIKCLKKNILHFFKNNPETFHVDDKNCVSLVKSSVDLEFNDKGEKIEDCNIESLNLFIQCADFFCNILKKKSVPIHHLSGYLSTAKPEVVEYLNSNYTTFKDFLLDVDKLFVFNVYNEVSVTKNGPKLLKNAKIELNSAIAPQSLKHILYSQLKSESSSKPDTLLDKHQADNCSGLHKLDISNKENFDDSILYSAKDKKLEAKKLNTSDDDNVNVESNDRNKTIENKFEHENLSSIWDIADVEKENIKQVEDDNVVALEDVDETIDDFFNSGDSVFDKIKSSTQRNFIECVFTVQLLCLEVAEKEYILCLKYEYEAVKFFVEILEKCPGKTSFVTFLKGNLGQASKDVTSFIKSLYKGDKIKLFFEKYKEFDLSSHDSSVKLSSSFKDHLEEKRKLHQLFIDGRKVYNVYNLYNSHLNVIFVDVLDCLIKICCFLQNKSRTKLSRLFSVYSNFSTSQQSFIHSLNGSEIHEKLKNFLSYFTFFDIVDGSIEFCSELNLDILLLINLVSEFYQKLSKFDKSKSPKFDYLLDYLMEYENEYSILSFEELKDCVIDGVKDILSSCLSSFEYPELPNIVGYEVLHNLALKEKDSQFLIQLLEESELFLLDDGKVSYKQENDEEVPFVQDTELSNDTSEILPDIENEENNSEQCKQISNENLKSIISEDDVANDLHVDPEANGTFSSTFENEDLNVVLFNKSKLSNEKLNKQNDLNHENKFMNMLNSSITAQDDSQGNDENNKENECNISEILSGALNLELENNASHKQEIDSASEKQCITDETVKVVKNVLKESNEGAILENVDLINRQKDVFNVNETNLSESDVDFSKSSFLSNSFEGNSKIKESMHKLSYNTAAPLSLVKENYTSENNKQVNINVEDVDLNIVKNGFSPEDVFENEQLQNSSNCDYEQNAGHKNYFHNANLIENSNSGTTFSNMKSIVNVNDESNENNGKIDQSKILSVTIIESSTISTSNKSSKPKKYSFESNSESNGLQHGVDSAIFQPLQAKIIVMTLDSCIAETIINGQKKCIFCLKSCFDCDLHTLCSDCFDSLNVGDEILCYISSTKDVNCGNMCFSFMFYKDLEADNKSVTPIDMKSCLRRNKSKEKNEVKYSSSANNETTFQKENDETTFEKNNVETTFQKENNETTFQKESAHHQNFLPVLDQCQTVRNEVKPHTSVVEKGCQVQSLGLSLGTQTLLSSVNDCPGIEKGCQVESMSVSQVTQTVNRTFEVESQTALVGEVKVCPLVSEKACLTKFPMLSQNTQTFCEVLEHGSQTNISGNIVPRFTISSSACQTALTGSVQKCANLSDKCCQTLSSQTTNSTQTDSETNVESFHIPFNGAHNENSLPVVQNLYCDMACQTLSTGDIMMRTLHLTL